MRTIEIFFDYVSPFPYLLNEYILKNDVEGRYKVTFEWTPLFLGGLYPENNHMPYNASDPRRLAYSAIEAHRYARELSVPLSATVFPPIPVARAGVAAKRQGRFREFHTTLYRRVQGEGRTPDEALLTDTMNAVGGDGQQLVADLSTPEVKQAVLNNAERARQNNVFGVPFAIFDGEPFWGYSHFPYLLAKLERG